MAKTKVVSLRVPEESYEKILLECEKKDISISEWYERKLALAKSKKSTSTITRTTTIPQNDVQLLQPETPKKDFIFLFAIISFTLFIGFAILSYAYSNENKEMTNKYNKTLDSLNNELFIKQTELGRYDMGLELLKEEDSTAADKFQNILKSKTE